MLKTNVIVFLFLLFFNTGCAQNRNEETKNGQYKIIVGEQNKAQNQQAAKVLMSYLNKNVKLYDSANKTKEITTIELNSSTGLKASEFSIQYSNGVLTFNGGPEKGLLYGVYTFIEDVMNVKWYTYQKKEEGLNRIFLKSGFSIKSSPSFEFRSIYSNDFLQHTDFADFHKVNYAFEGRKLYAHSFNDFVNPEAYFNRHPEYFAQINGKRSKDQLCLSRPEVYEIVRKELGKKIKQNPEIKNWSFSQNDNLHVCQCNLCRSKINNDNEFSEILIPFVNKLAKEFPNYTISTLAFNQSVRPPKSIRPRENVEIMFCIADYDRFYAFGDAKDKKSVETYDSFVKWAQISNNIFIWDYTVNFFNTSSPFPNIQTLQRSLQLFKKFNVKGVFMQGVGEQQGEFAELKSYLLSKLLWNVNANSEAIVRDFMSQYYGPGWSSINEYIDQIYSRNKGKFYLSNWEDYNFKSFDVYRNYDYYKNFFTKALSKTSNEEQKKRILKEFVSVQYNYIENLKHLKSSGNITGNPVVKEFKKNSDFVKLDYLKYKDYKINDYLNSLK